MRRCAALHRTAVLEQHCAVQYTTTLCVLLMQSTILCCAVPISPLPYMAESRLLNAAAKRSTTALKCSWISRIEIGV